jgi:hypothetical protein
MKTVPRKFLALAILLGLPLRAVSAVHYVDLNSTNATPPYTNWTTAATNIQDAVDAAVSGDEVVVTNGVYAYGGRTTVDATPNRVSVDKTLSLRSVNGPTVTTIDGLRQIRCAYLTNGASLFGFTLTKGAAAYFGGGVFCESSNAVVSNCVITGNSAIGLDYGSGAAGGGAYGGTLNNCTLANNEAYADFPYGGGASSCALNNCVLSGNWANSYGDLPDSAFGGGADHCTLNNCTVTGNSVYTLNYHQYRFGGGAYGCTLNNCIVCSNRWSGTEDDLLDSALDHCWVWPSDPLFMGYAGGDLRLQSNSPCINAGNNAFAPAGPDLHGNPRIVGGTVDIGAYEYQSLSLMNFSIVSNQAGFEITGQSNQVVIVESSPDLMNWLPLSTNTLNGHPFPFSDPTTATVPRRFYRAQAQ